MAGRTAKRSRRALRALLLVGAAALALGVSAPVAVPGPTVSAVADVPSVQEILELHGSPAGADPTHVRPALPRGYGTVAWRAAQAAAEAEAARVAVAAAEAAAAAARAQADAAAAAARTAASPSAGRSAPSASASSRTPAAAPTGLPLGVDPGSSTQVVTVVAASSGATSAKLTAWQRGPSGWTAVVGPVNARIGSAGVGRASETSTRTPAGTFTLTEAFGRAGNPGTALPYRVVDGDDWWVSDVNSPQYNRYAQCAPTTCPFDERASENLYAAGSVYDYAAVIDYNRGGTPGAGSAFFLHVTNGAPTAGCVAIDAGSLVRVLQWLDPGSRPLIAIGVG